MSDAEVVVVAEVTTSIAGFGAIVPTSEELRALYVSPAFCRTGVGSAILLHLESLARERGNQELHLKASLNAVDFYQKRGFETVRTGLHRISDDVEMACTEMRKSL